MRITVAPQHGHQPAPMDLPGWDPAAHDAAAAAAEAAVWDTVRARHVATTARARVVTAHEARVRAVIADMIDSMRGGLTHEAAAAAAELKIAEIDAEKADALAALSSPQAG